MTNPFQPTKFEWEKRPTIWLSSWVQKIVQVKRPHFVVGTRGSGKTTVLRSLHTKEILTNEFLREQYGSRHFHWFGLYMQFNQNFQFVTEQIYDQVSICQKRQITEIEKYRLFCAYFELSLLECFLEDLKSLEDSGELHFSASKEHEACSELKEMFLGLGASQARELRDYADASRLIRSLRSSFLSMYDPDRINETLRVVDAFVPNTLIRLISEKIVPSIYSKIFNRSKPIDLYILVDDCENLSRFQQSCLNTYIRSSEGRAKWVIAYVRGRYNTVGTQIPETSLSHADRTFVNVDSLADDDFRNFCESVVTLRLRSFLSASPKESLRTDGRFDLSKCGNYSYNNLIDEALSGYQSAAVKKFKDETYDTKNKLIGVIESRRHASFSITSDKMPYIEHTILKLLNWNVFEYGHSSDQERLRKEVHRKEGAAYIAGCKMAERSPVYAGVRFVLWASDGNIRDFLDVMAEFFDRRLGARSRSSEKVSTVAKVCKGFLNPSETFPVQFQNDCLRSVSLMSLETIKEMKDTSDRHLYYFLLGLGELQRIMHHSIDFGEAVRTPERGIFVVNYDQFDRLGAAHSLTGISALVRRVERDGFLRIIESGDGSEKSEISFRLHKRLAPALECSPRGAYERVRLDPELLVRLLSQREPVQPKEWARAMYGIVVGRDDRQSSLPI